MKKLIPILSLAVLSSCASTTKVNLASLPPEIIPLELLEVETIPPVATVKHKNTKKIAASIPVQSSKIAAKLTTSEKGQGIASWYGDYFHGKKTATGELFDMYAMTAAHNSLPLDSYAEITNVENHRTVIVRINDRGPFIDNRVLDLSYSAAKQLGMDVAGLGEVAIKAIPSTQALKQLQKQNQPVYLQVGSFSDKKLAEDLLTSLTEQHLSEPKMSASSSKKTTLYNVFVPIKSSRHASDLNNKLAKLGITDTQFVTETN